MNLPLALGLALTLAGALRADATLSKDDRAAYNTSPDPHASLGVPPAPVVVPSPVAASYPSQDAPQGLSGTPGPAVPASHLWEVQPILLAGLASHGNLQGPAIEFVLNHWFTAQLFVGLHSDGRYNAVSQGLDLRLFPTGHAPRGAYLEAQDDFVQENAAPPTQGVYHAQRVGLAVGWQWLLRGSISVNAAGAWTQEDATYSSHPYPAIGSNHDSAVDRSQAALDLGLGWYF